MKATGRYNWMPTQNVRICSEHFEESCFIQTQTNRELKRGSVPTLNIQYYVENNPSCSKTTKTVSIGTQTLLIKDSCSCKKAANVSGPPIIRNNLVDRKTIKMTEIRKLVNKLNEKIELAEERKKQIAKLRSRNWRLEKRNAELYNILEDLTAKVSVN